MRRPGVPGPGLTEEVRTSGGQPQLLSEAACHDILSRLKRVTRGGGSTMVHIASTWIGSVRWARNLISTSGESRDNLVQIGRSVRGATSPLMLVNETTDAALVAAVRRAERLLVLAPEQGNWGLFTHATMEPATAPTLFSDATYRVTPEQRADAAIQACQTVNQAGMLSAGYLQISAQSLALLDTEGRSRFFRYTWAQYSVTVRDPQGTGSGWAGVDWHDWSRIDPESFVRVALDKCLTSRNPVAIEPGRYTTILEPQAVSGLVDALVMGLGGVNDPIGRETNELKIAHGPFFKHGGKGDPRHPETFVPRMSKLGEKVTDERITISVDPMDPELGFPPFSLLGDWATQSVYHPAVWINQGVLTALSYNREYAVKRLDMPTGLPNPKAYRMSGGNTSVDEMIATTRRGLLVTRFDQLLLLNEPSMLLRGYTRDGLWLIEQGKIARPVRNMVFTESVLFALNSVEQLGVPQRVFHGWHGGFQAPTPVIVPPLKITDFSFTGLTDAV